MDAQSRFIESLIAFLLALFSLLGIGGCQLWRAFDASNVGVSTDTANISYTSGWFSGTKFEIGSQFSGRLEYDADTNGLARLVAVVDSNPVNVIGAQGERARALETLQAQEIAFKNRQSEIVGENFEKFGNMLAIAIAAGGDAAQRVIDAALPLLAGSRAELDLGGFGGGAIQLGSPQTNRMDPQPTAPPATQPKPGAAEPVTQFE